MDRDKRTQSEMVKSVSNQKKRDDFIMLILSIAGVVGFFIVWQLLVDTGIISSKYVERPSKILKLFFTKLTDSRPDGSVLGVNILASLQVSLTGFIAAIVTGVPLGLLMGWYKGFDKFVSPIFEIVRPVPPISWIPLTIVWMGIGLQAKAFIIFFSAFIPCVINSYTGIKLTKQALIDVSKTFGASNFTTFYKIGIPSAMPMVFAGVRIALGNSWATLVAAEMLAASAGLGYMILMGRQFARPDIIILGMLVIGAIGAMLTAVLGFAESRMLRWRKTR
jgi:NitT/TauT family transport system permease protein